MTMDMSGNMKNLSPRVYLVLDNCFALKRWVKPFDWMELCSELGFRYVQASTDNEIDPLFSTSDYMDEWFDEAVRAQQKTGIKIANFYTGYQTYRTVGLAHFNREMVSHIRENWINELIKRASKLGVAGMGFSWFALAEEIMQSPKKYAETEARLIDELAKIAETARDYGDFQVSFEQMYVPYQPPFTIAQAEAYLKKIYQRGNPLYVTLDTGHMIGQIKYVKPDVATIEKSITEKQCIWLGADEAESLWEYYCENGDAKSGAAKIAACIEKYPYMFTEIRDADEYAWIRRMAKYSPIFHMQQTNGEVAGHRPFTPKNNEWGIISGEKLFDAIKQSYDETDNIQPPVEDIYLSFELFFSNMDTKRSILDALKKTLEYWRRFVPEDGITLDEIIKLH